MTYLVHELGYIVNWEKRPDVKYKWFDWLRQRTFTVNEDVELFSRLVGTELVKGNNFSGHCFSKLRVVRFKEFGG